MGLGHLEKFKQRAVEGFPKNWEALFISRRSKAIEM
jgi:hypothetical protein